VARIVARREECGKEGGLWQGGRIVARREECGKECGKEGGLWQGGRRCGAPLFYTGVR